MKYITVFLLTFFMLAGYGVAADSVVRISTGEWVPMTGQYVRHGGFVNHVVAEAFQRVGYEVVFEYTPWPRAYELAINGDVDASSYWYHTEKRAQDCWYSDPVISEKIVFFHLKGKPVPKWERLADLKGLRIAAITGVGYTDEFWELGERGVFTIFESNDSSANFEKLIRTRVDLFPAAKVMGEALLRTGFTEAERNVITHGKKPLAVRTGHVVFSRRLAGSEQLMKAFDVGLKQIREDGTYEKLYRSLLRSGYDAETVR